MLLIFSATWLDHGTQPPVHLLLISLDGARPDAILATNSLTTAGAFQALRSRGIAIPEEVALAGFDETTWTTMVEPPVTVIAQPTYDIGRTAADLLLQRLSEPTRSTRVVLLKGSLIVRRSSGAGSG